MFAGSNNLVILRTASLEMFYDECFINATPATCFSTRGRYCNYLYFLVGFISILHYSVSNMSISGDLLSPIPSVINNRTDA